MSANRKPHGTPAGKPESELTRLKVLWPTLAESAQDFWRERFTSLDSQAKIRAELLAKLKINLRFDGKLTAFRQWLMELDQMEDEQARAGEEERQVLQAHPEWTKDQVQEELIKRMLFRSLATGNTCLGLKVIKANEVVKRGELESRRIVLLEKKAAAYDRAQAALEKAKTSKGGITPETFKHIEQELRLL